MENNYTYLKLLQSKDISFWDVIRLSFSQKKLSNKFPLVKLGKIISPRKEKIKKTEYKGEEQIVSKISFNDGKLHLRANKATGMDLFRLYKSDLLVSNINFHQGAVAINNIDILACSTHYQPYIVDYTNVEPQYLILILRNQHFLNYVVKQKTNGIKTESKYNFIKELEIPLPSIEKQKELVAEYEQLQKLAAQKEEEAKKIENSIDEYLLSELGIDNIEKAKDDKSLFYTVNYNELNAWDVKSLSNIQTFLKSRIYNNYRMQQILSINPRTSVPTNICISFIPMENIDEKYGEIKKLEEKNSNAAKGYTKFLDNDIIWAKITPCMQNGKSAIVQGLLNGYGCGSTEFYVIRNNKNNELIRVNYIYFLLRMKILLTMAKKTFTGACGQQRVPVNFLEELIIPIPPIDIQDKLISSVIVKKDNIKKLRNESEQLKQQAISDFEREVFN
ncbi:MAG: restriction endonuclease subunit S [Alphaproteobacteria bacterium]|nr:restriction endonuclease subunit S [Alphaproteobacteria bacterium]